MPTPDILKALLQLKKHILMIQNCLDQTSEFYTTKLSDTHPHSIQERTDAALSEIESLITLGTQTAGKRQDKELARSNASVPLTDAIGRLLKTLEFAKTLPQNPVPNETWEEPFLNPLKQFANFFLWLADKELYVITSTEDNTNTIKTTQSQIKAEHATHKDNLIQKAVKKVVPQNMQKGFENFMADDPESNILPTADELKTKATNTFTGLKTGLGTLLNRSSTPEDKSPDKTSSSSSKPLGPGESRDD
jgi:hypothetical protein